MTQKETIKVLQSIEDRAVDFPYMTACDWVAIAAAKRHLENNLEVKEVQEPTASDKGMAEEIIVYLKRVEQDYHIDLTREMEWLRSKVKKGE